MQLILKEHKKFSKNSYGLFILAGDIGGTNTALGIFGINDKPVLLSSFHFKSRELNGLGDAVSKMLEYSQKNYKIKVTKACFAVAGVLSENRDFVATQNIKWDVSKTELLKKTSLKRIIFLNDFEAIGYAMNVVNKKDVLVIKKAKKVPKAPILIVGAGTGLGKTALAYNEGCKAYVPIPSEAGHTDFPAQTKLEFELVDFIKKSGKIKQNVSYEHVLSGQGLINIYDFLRKSKKLSRTKFTGEIAKSKNKAETISKYRKADAVCRAAFEIFTLIYAKFARNCALDTLAYGGVYIAGGIAPKNKDIFGKRFVKAFEDNYRLQSVLKKIPIYLITSQDAGLIGAGFAGGKLIKG